jgi:hypothetical protein
MHEQGSTKPDQQHGGQLQLHPVQALNAIAARLAISAFPFLTAAPCLLL